MAGLASAGGAVAGARLLRGGRAGRAERLYVTVFSEPGYLGANRTLTCAGDARSIVPLSRMRLPRIGSLRLEREVYRFRPSIAVPSVRLLWQAVTERPDPTEAEGDLIRMIAMHQVLGMVSLGGWEPADAAEDGGDGTGTAVRTAGGRARGVGRLGVRLWAERPTGSRGSRGAGSGGVGGARSVGPKDAGAGGDRGGADGGGADGGPWREVLASTPDVGAWSTRTRYLELGYRSAGARD